MDGFYRDKLILKTEEDVWMPFYVLIPEDYKDGEKKTVALLHATVMAVVESCLLQARMILVSRDSADEILACTCAPLNHQAISLGLSLDMGLDEAY